ncbi:hypothetical protein B0H13DRAFT_2324161 [Mycena leptocephala]|nr:hypothetical protein B0H13DRAFT_2324161 [Mycena leptocephala]
MSTYAYTRVDGGEEARPMRPAGKKPYLGLTGTRLGGWVTVACTAAMVLFAPGPLADDEPVLAALASDIAARRGALAGLRARSDHVSTLVTLYALALWAAYHTAWYFGFVAAGSPVFVGPVMILFIRRIVQIWYNRKGNAEEKTLRALLKVISRDIRIVIFIETDVKPLDCWTAVEDTTNFAFRDTELFEVSNAGGTPPSLYERYVVEEDKFTSDSGILSTVDISNSGTYIIYRRAGMRDSECLGLAQLRLDIQTMRYGAAPTSTVKEAVDVWDNLAYDSDEADVEEDGTAEK